MINEVTPHFSRKILFLSFIFLLANLGIYGLRSASGPSTELRSVAPKLVSAMISGIEVKTPYDKSYKPAQAGQEIYAGDYVKTGEKEFAELNLENNVIRLDEFTEIRLVRNNFSGASAYLPDTPRLEFELVSGGIWVNAFDLINVYSPRSMARLHHSAALLTYSTPINRLMVFTGAVDLNLMSAEGKLLSDFVVPLNNQVTFIDTQITDTYAALKPSKLKKELKMSPIAPEILADIWVARNTGDTGKLSAAISKNLITSDLSYQIRSWYQKGLSYLAILPEAKRSLAINQAKTLLHYILGAVQQKGDLEAAQTLIGQFKSLVALRKNDPQINNLILETLFGIESTREGTPAYLLKEALIQYVAAKEGPYVYGIYLSDARRALFAKDVQAAAKAEQKWLDSWKTRLNKENITEFDRQAQILDHTILSYITTVTSAMLDTFDSSGMMILANAKDVEEARFEIITNRLQIASSLISSYRYVLAKQYLKNTYLGLNIETLSPDLASTQVFLENGKLFAQRIEYAEAVLRGAAQPIDETKFLAYFQTLKRDEALSADLRKFFELDKGTVVVETEAKTPTAAQVASRFLDARINVNFADISVQPETNYFSVKNARLMDRGISTKPLSFDATYDYLSNSVMDVVAFEKTYKGPFALADVVTLLKQGGTLESRINKPEIQEGVELLITDQEKIAAEEGQAIAQDVAKQLAYNQLTAYGIVIPEVKYGIEVLDILNLNTFRVKNAYIPRLDLEGSVGINFDYSALTGEVTNVKSTEGIDLIAKTTAKELPALVQSKITEIEKQLKDMSDFSVFVRQNDLFIKPENISYTKSGNISFMDLELPTLGFKVSGFYDPVTKTFTTVSNPLLTGQNVNIKNYFQQLMHLTVIAYMNGKGYVVTPNQIVTKYPFETIQISQMNLEGYLFSFTLDMTNNKALQVEREGDVNIIPEFLIEDLKLQPELIRASQQLPPA